MPELNRVYRSNKGQGLVLIGIHSDPNSANGLAAAKENKLEYAIVQDQNGKTQTLYNVQYYPTVVVIDKKGKIRFTDPRDLEGSVKQLLKER